MTLPYSTLDAHSPVPLYHQIYLDLRRMIQAGIIAPGGMLPAELEISQAYNVGRHTVRQAIARLVDDDLLERFAGRGTFVRAQPSHTQFFLDRSFSQQMRELGRVPHSRVLGLQQGTVDSSVLPALQEYNGQACITLERLRLGDEEPVCHQLSTILTQRCPGIEQQDFENQSMYEILAARYHLSITRIDHVVRAIAADEYRTDLLHVAEGTPLLFVGTTTFLDDGQVIEHTASYYRADRYEYSTTQTCCE
jgi:GntR family transcriptional regulator